MIKPLILAIDTSCDETAVAVSQGRQILSNVISSQINIHAKWGGVVPHLAKRAHQQKIDFVIKEALKRSATIESISAIAVTIGPGLAPALEVGINKAKQISKTHHLPLIAINHMEGHLLSSFALNSKGNGPIMEGSEPSNFPMLGLLVSGGHTQLVLVKDIGEYLLLGETLDDAAGEAFDKLAKMLKLGYPGGPIVEQMAKKGVSSQIPLPVPMQHSADLNFSFSGLKTACLYTIQKQKNISKQFTYDICSSFQNSVATSLTTKLSKAIDRFQPNSILLGGGVISNLFVRNKIRQTIKKYNIPVYIPFTKTMFTDNAAMITTTAYYRFLNKDFVNNPQKLDRIPALNFQNRL